MLVFALIRSSSPLSAFIMFLVFHPSISPFFTFIASQSLSHYLLADLLAFELCECFPLLQPKIPRSKFVPKFTLAALLISVLRLIAPLPLASYVGLCFFVVMLLMSNLGKPSLFHPFLFIPVAFPIVIFLCRFPDNLSFPLSTALVFDIPFLAAVLLGTRYCFSQFEYRPRQLDRSHDSFRLICPSLFTLVWAGFPLTVALIRTLQIASFYKTLVISTRTFIALVLFDLGSLLGFFVLRSLLANHFSLFFPFLILGIAFLYRKVYPSVGHTTVACWEWLDDDNTYKRYSDDDSLLIEQAYQAQTNTLFRIGGTLYLFTNLRTNSPQQCNLNTNFSRSIRRVTVTVLPSQEKFSLPREWDQTNTTPQLVQLDEKKHDREYQNVSTHFFETVRSQDYEILSISRVRSFLLRLCFPSSCFSFVCPVLCLRRSRTLTSTCLIVTIAL
jgi:hypothetical protein